MLLNTTLELKQYYFGIDQKLLLSRSETRPQHSRIAFLTYLIESYGSQLTKDTIIFICDPLTEGYNSLIYDILFSPLSCTLFEFFKGVKTELHTTDHKSTFKKSSFGFLKRVASTLNSAALQSRKRSVHKINGQVLEGRIHLLKTNISAVAHVDLPEEEIIDTLLTWYFTRFWRILAGHILSVTKIIAKNTPKQFTNFQLQYNKLTTRIALKKTS